MKSLVLGYFILPQKAAELGNPLVLSDVNSQPPLQEPRYLVTRLAFASSILLSNQLSYAPPPKGIIQTQVLSQAGRGWGGGGAAPDGAFHPKDPRHGKGDCRSLSNSALQALLSARLCVVTHFSQQHGGFCRQGN